ncbi:MAG: ABC transporter permease [Calditrichaeota bacterium]|nr:ABC transporter permease [Calditrichota bacterium]MCB9365843.1 ABC transporter permease [Calditrichota bacterium]
MTLLWVRIGIRNVIKQRRRTLFNVLALGVNTGMLILLVGVLRGFYLITIEKTVDLRTGHVQIHAEGYQEEKRRLPLTITIEHAGEVTRAVESLPDVVAASPRIVCSATLSNGRNRAAVVLYGVIPSQEERVGVVLNGVKRGATLSDSVQGILIGDRLAELLDADIGSSLMLFAQTQDRANNLVDADVVGIFDSGFGIADRGAVYAPLSFVYELLDMQDEVTEIVIRAENLRVVPKLTEEMTSTVSSVTTEPLEVQPWYDVARDIVAAVKADLVSYGIIGFILVTLAVFGVSNTMTVSVFERTGEIGALRALGMEAKQIHAMFLAEGIALGLLGFVIGSGIGALAAWYMNVYGIALPKDAIEAVSMPLADHYYARSLAVDWLIGAGLSLASAWLGSVLPARRASRVPVTAALAKGVR